MKKLIYFIVFSILLANCGKPEPPKSKVNMSPDIYGCPGANWLQCRILEGGGGGGASGLGLKFSIGGSRTPGTPNTSGHKSYGEGGGFYLPKTPAKTGGIGKSRLRNGAFSKGGPSRDPKTGNYLPDPNASGAHTRLGTRSGRSGKYTQGATFDASGNFKGRVDATNHGRADHSNPHWHPANGPNSVVPGGHHKFPRPGMYYIIP